MTARHTLSYWVICYIETKRSENEQNVLPPAGPPHQSGGGALAQAASPRAPSQCIVEYWQG